MVVVKRILNGKRKEIEMSKLEQLLAQRAAMDEAIAAEKTKVEMTHWLLCVDCASNTA